ncbi:hypothetical protein phiK7A1_082 [Pseudomonas phage phiK7A1]|uniref:Cyanophage baseplate Pam3 plug gp18 domain-containing protein n=1 Tax=Pseudomonas phage phiK7A1 TaxID=2759194 RepID=A0A7H0XFT0_9CAUD|nr:hypothetical protein phiK7A1_082 [Pseudomonas phage phiK7A1]
MATTTIIGLPLYKDPIYRYGVTLEEEAKQLTFYWNSRCKQWHMDMHNEDQTVVVQGIPLVAQYPILIDYPLEAAGLTGYFILLPVNSSQVASLNDDMSIMPQFFELFYTYITE